MVHQVNKLTLFMYNYYDKQKRACIASRKYKRMYTVNVTHPWSYWISVYSPFFGSVQRPANISYTRKEIIIRNATNELT